MKRIMVGLLVLTMLIPITTANAASKQLRIGHIQNVDQTVHLACVEFARLVEERTNGSLKIKVFPNSQLGSALTQISSVKMGTLDMFVDGIGWFGQLVGDYNLPSTAWAVRDREHMARVVEGEIGQEMADKMIKQHGLRVLSHNWEVLPRQLISKRPIRIVDDVKGLKIRVPELACYLEPWKAVGASPTPIAFGEVYLALQQGICEAMECQPDMIYTQRFHEVAKYMSLTSHVFEPNAPIINEKTFQKLTPEEQDILIKSCYDAGIYNNKLNEKVEAEIFEKLENEGVTIIEVDTDAFYDKAKDVSYKLEKEGLWSEGLYERVMELAQSK